MGKNEEVEMPLELTHKSWREEKKNFWDYLGNPVPRVRKKTLPPLLPSFLGGQLPPGWKEGGQWFSLSLSLSLSPSCHKSGGGGGWNSVLLAAKGGMGKRRSAIGGRTYGKAPEPESAALAQGIIFFHGPSIFGHENIACFREKRVQAKSVNH